MALHLHRAPRTDALADALGDLLATPLPDPFAGELVLVPAAGIERWLSQRLSHRLGRGRGEDGVCAGVEFRSPASLVAALTGADQDDPWAPDALAWVVLETLDASLDEPWASTLAQHLGHRQEGDEAEFRLGRRYAVARRLAGLFASYAVQRPLLLQDWLDGRDTDGLGSPLDHDLHWQPPLWRAVVDRVAAPPPHQRHAATLQRLGEGIADLPARFSLFGHTRMPASEIELLEALAEHHDLHIWLPHPSDHLWQSLAGESGSLPRREDLSHRRVGHPLTATLGRDLRDLQRALPEPDGIQVIDVSHEVDPRSPETLLGWLQEDLRVDEVRSAGRALAAEDRSVQVHQCHGAARQVDVLREVLLGLLADDPTLEPRDVLVMCPDIETYAPLITARFGLADVVDGGHPAHQLRVQLADRALSRTNPLLAVAEQLLTLAGSRTTASSVLDLVASGPVRRRFAVSDDDLDALTDWTREAGVRWGLDRNHRAPYGVAYLQNTWRFGLDRVLAGVALSDDAAGWLDTTLPLDDVGSNRVELAGRFAELIDRLATTTDALTGSHPLTHWIEALATGVMQLTSVSRADQWQIGHLQRELRSVLTRAGERDDVTLRLPDVRSLLAGRLAGRPTRANFRTGTLTVCTMVPMRSVPHRVVCMLGLDDGIFPRLGAIDGDDALMRTPVTGERDVRSEDRQLLLDAIGAAQEHLVITYTGANEHSGQPRPPAVPLGELLDALDQTTEAPVREHIVVQHPLQPFDTRNVEPGQLGSPGPFTFDPTMLVAARAASSTQPAAPEFLASPLPAPPQEDVALADVVAFFKDPVKGFFRALDVTLPWEADGLSDAMPVEIDQLESWGVGDRMLADMLRLIHPDAAREAEWRRGHLPPGRLGWRKVGEVREMAMNLALAALTHRQVTPHAVDVDVALPDGRRLTGTVGPIYGDRLVSVGYSKLAGKHVLESWIRLLALAAHDPDHNYTALVIGRPPKGVRAMERLLAPGGEDGPLPMLADLVNVYDAGRRSPLPLPIKTSYAWAAAELVGDNAMEQAGRKWRSARYPGEDAEPGQIRVWGAFAPLERLLEPGGLGPGYTLPELASRVWLPLLQNERSF